MNMLYYSTNSSIKTVVSLRNKALALENEVYRLLGEVEELYFNNKKELHSMWRAIQEYGTAGLGFKLWICEADYWATERLWGEINTPKGKIVFELHWEDGLKEICDHRIKRDGLANYRRALYELKVLKWFLTTLLK